MGFSAFFGNTVSTFFAKDLKRLRAETSKDGLTRRGRLIQSARFAG